MTGARVTILYPAASGARFDFGYYVPNHLPLAVGTSLRHAAITGCDASRPLHDDSAFACICTVTFPAVAAMHDFRHFFATGHPDTTRIFADEPNYTDITPRFVAGVVHGPGAPALHPAQTGYRLQLVLPAAPGTRFDAEVFAGDSAGDVARELARVVPFVATSADVMMAGVLPDSAPELHGIWTAWVDSANDLQALRHAWAGGVGTTVRKILDPCTDAPMLPVFAAVSTLDMALARLVAARGPSAAGDRDGSGAGH